MATPPTPPAAEQKGMIASAWDAVTSIGKTTAADIDVKITKLDEEAARKKAEVDDQTAKDKAELEKQKAEIQAADAAKKGGRRRKHTKKHKKSKSRRGRTGRKSSRL